MKRLVFLLVSMLLLSASWAAAAPEKKIPYSKKTSLVVPKTYSFTFSLWDEPAVGDGQMVWSEPKSILLKSPKVTTNLGDVVSFDFPANPFGPVDFSQQLYVQVEYATKSGKKVIGTVRDRLGVVPYALWSAASDSAIAGGSVASVFAGSGITSSGTTGDVTLDVGAGTGISVAPDAVSLDLEYTDGRYAPVAHAHSGSDITTGTVIEARIDSAIQRRVVGSCPPGQSIRAIDAAGAVTCQADSNSGGTVTQVDSGAGLTGGPITSAGSIGIADNGIVTAMLQGGAVTDAKIASASTWNNKQPKHIGAVYRWQEFDTFTEASGWLMSNDPTMFGGVAPNVWTDGGATALNMSADKEVLRTLLTRKGYGGKNAVVQTKTFLDFSTTSGHVTVALFRIRNTTQSAIPWIPYFWYTAYSGWGEAAGVAVNGVNAWTTNASAPHGSQVAVPLFIPANRVSTVIFTSPSGQPFSIVANIYKRANILAFYNNSLLLPAGLEYVDDLDTATGGWEQ